MLNLCSEPECTISGYRSCEHGFVTKASILLLWTLNVDCGSFGAFHDLRDVKRRKTYVSSVNSLFGVRKFWCIS
jgi:hypothetical protein